LPAILAGVTTAAQILQLVDNTLKPQNAAAQQQCANRIAALPQGAQLTSVVAACDELVDAWYAVEAVAEQLRRKGARTEVNEAKLVARAKARIAEFDASYRQYQRDVP
jgi:DNA repair ATPase RecN